MIEFELTNPKQLFPRTSTSTGPFPRVNFAPNNKKPTLQITQKALSSPESPFQLFKPVARPGFNQTPGTAAQLQASQSLA